MAKRKAKRSTSRDEVRYRVRTAKELEIEAGKARVKERRDRRGRYKMQMLVEKLLREHREAEGRVKDDSEQVEGPVEEGRK